MISVSRMTPLGIPIPETRVIDIRRLYGFDIGDDRYSFMSQRDGVSIWASQGPNGYWGTGLLSELNAWLATLGIEPVELVLLKPRKRDVQRAGMNEP